MSCPSTVVWQMQHRLAMPMALAGHLLSAVATGVHQILKDVGALLISYAANCTPMAWLTTDASGHNRGLVYWIDAKRAE